MRSLTGGLADAAGVVPVVAWVCMVCGLAGFLVGCDGRRSTRTKPSAQHTEGAAVRSPLRTSPPSGPPLGQPPGVRAPATPKEPRITLNPNHDRQRVAFDPGGRYVYLAARSAVQMRDLRAPTTARHRSLRCPGGAEAILIDPSGRFLLVRGTTSVVVWDVQNKQAGKVVYRANRIKGSAAVFSGSGGSLAMAEGGGRFRVIETRDWKVTRTLQLPTKGRPSGAEAEASAPDQQLWLDAQGSLLVAMEGPVVAVWRVTSGALLRTLRAGTYRDENGQQAPDAFSQMAVSDDGRLLATVTQSARLVLWNLRSGRVLRKKQYPVSPCCETVDRIAFAPRRGLLLVGRGCDARIDVWDAKRWRRLRSLQHRGSGCSGLELSPSPSGDLVVSTVRSKISAPVSLVVWTLSTGRLLRRLVFDPRGGFFRSLVALRFDRTSRRVLWVSGAGRSGSLAVKPGTSASPTSASPK